MLASGIAIPLLIWFYTLLPSNFTFDYLVRTLQLYRNPYNAEGTILVNFLRFFKESTPIHFALLLVAFFLSKIFIKPRKWLRLEIILTVFVVLDFIFYLKTAGWYRYFFPAHVLLFVLFPPALGSIAQGFGAYAWVKRNAQMIVVAALTATQIVVLVVNTQASLYYDRTPRQFAEDVNQAVPPGTGILVVDIPEISFLLNREDIWYYLRANPHITFGADLLSTRQFPAYIISGPWESNYYLTNYSPIRSEYGIKIDNGKYILYEKKKPNTKI